MGVVAMAHTFGAAYVRLLVAVCPVPGFVTTTGTVPAACAGTVAVNDCPSAATVIGSNAPFTVTAVPAWKPVPVKERRCPAVPVCAGWSVGVTGTYSYAPMSQAFPAAA